MCARCLRQKLRCDVLLVEMLLTMLSMSSPLGVVADARLPQFTWSSDTDTVDDHTAFGTALGTSMVLRPLVDTLEAFVVLVRTAERGAPAMPLLHGR